MVFSLKEKCAGERKLFLFPVENRHSGLVPIKAFILYIINFIMAIPFL